MRFDTMLKLGTHAANLWKHESFQEMSKMIHKGVKRRMPEHLPMHFGPHYGPYGPNGPYPYTRTTRPQKANQAATQRPQNPPAHPLGQLLTTDNLKSVMAVRQMIKDITNFGKK